MRVADYRIFEIPKQINIVYGDMERKVTKYWIDA